MRTPTPLGYRWLASAALALTLAMSPFSSAQAQQTFVQVFDASGAAVRDLSADDFVVRQNDIDCEIVRVELINEPLRLALLVDDSDGAGAYFQFLRDGLPAFVDLLPESSEVGLFMLSGRARLVVDFDEGVSKVREQLEDYFVASGGSGFADGMIDALRRFPDGTRWPVIAAITTDGPATRRDTFTPGKHQALIDELGERAATVHALGLSTLRGDGFQTRLASDTAQYTGGWYDQVASPSQIVLTKLPQLAEELAARHAASSNQYLIEFESPPGVDPGTPVSAGVRRSGVTVVISPDGRPRPISRGNPTRTTSATPTGSSREELWNAAEVAFGSGDVEQAGALYEQAHQVDPTWGKPLFKLGLVALNQGDIEAAVRYFEQVIEVDPGSEEGAQATGLVAQLKP